MLNIEHTATDIGAPATAPSVLVQYLLAAAYDRVLLLTFGFSRTNVWVRGSVCARGGRERGPLSTTTIRRASQKRIYKSSVITPHIVVGPLLVRH